MKLTGINYKVVTSATPTTGGATTHGGAGFTPQFGLMLQGSAPVIDTHYTDDNGESFGISAFTCSTSASATIFSEDTLTNSSNTESLTSATPMAIRKDDADFLTASLTGCTSDGVTFNYGTVQAGAIPGAMLFVQQGSGRRAGSAIFFP